MRVEDLDIEVIRTRRRKTMQIAVERDGSVTARVPMSLSDEELSSVLRAKLYDIYTKQAYLRSVQVSSPQKRFEEGERFWYLGRRYMARFIDGGAFCFRNGCFLLPKAEENAAKLFEQYYRRRSQLHIGKMLRLCEVSYSEVYGKKAPAYRRVQVKELGNLWGSCTEMRNLYFNWRGVMAPRFVLLYIVTHEFCHLVELNHSARFWRLMERLLPEYKKAQLWLEKHGAELTL